LAQYYHHQKKSNLGRSIFKLIFYYKILYGPIIQLFTSDLGQYYNWSDVFRRYGNLISFYNFNFRPTYEGHRKYLGEKPNKSLQVRSAHVYHPPDSGKAVTWDTGALSGLGSVNKYIFTVRLQPKLAGWIKHWWEGERREEQVTFILSSPWIPPQGPPKSTNASKLDAGGTGTRAYDH